MLNKKSDGGKAMYRVALRYKIKADGKKKSIYLQFNPPIKDVRGKEIKYEFLNLDLYVNPANTAQKKYNQTVEEVAENIKCERYIQWYDGISVSWQKTIWMEIFLSIFMKTETITVRNISVPDSILKNSVRRSVLSETLVSAFAKSTGCISLETST